MIPSTSVSDPIRPLPPDWQVPAFSVPHEHERRHDYCIAVFVINEGAKVQKQLARMAPLADQMDLVVADGGSTDGSLGPDTLQAGRVNTLLVKTGPGKLSAQMRMALAWAMQRGYQGVITIDGNGKDGIGAIPDFADWLRKGYDHVQGSRFIPGGHHENTPASRLWGVRLLHAPLISCAAGARYTDTTNGFRAYSRRLLLDPRVQPFRDVFSRYELHYYLAIRAARLGFNCVETPVSRVYPSGGPVPTKISPVRGNLLVLQTLFRAVTGAYDPPASTR